jgi:hypothetical protein
MAIREPPTGTPPVTASVQGRVDRASTAEQPNETSGITSPSALLKVLGAVGGQITLLTALLFYFGWARTAAQTQYLGFDASALQLSTTDYVLRSVDTLFLPLFLLAAVLIGVQIAHPHIVSWCHTRKDRFLAWLRIAMPLILVTFPLAAWAATRPAPQWWKPVMPLSVTIAIVLCVYIALLARDLRQQSSAPSADAVRQRAAANKHERQPWWSTLQGTLAIALVVLSLFWTIGRFATLEGNSVAANFVSSIQRQDAATVTVLSKYDLRIDDLGVHTTRFSDGGAFRFEYQGLVLFTRSGGNFFLLPLGWTYEHPRVIVIPDNDEVRIYYVR